MWHIFEKRIVQGYQKSYSHVLNTQIQKYKYKNTQIKHMTKCQKDQTYGIFLKCGLFKDIKNYIPMSQTRKYKNTNSKYTNTLILHITFTEMPERSNMWYIFEKRIVQGYQKWCWCTDDNSLIMMHWQYCYIPQSLCVCHLEYSLRALVQHPCNTRVIYHKSFTTTQIEIVRPGVECFPDLLGIFLLLTFHVNFFSSRRAKKQENIHTGTHIMTPMGGMKREVTCWRRIKHVSDDA